MGQITVATAPGRPSSSPQRQDSGSMAAMAGQDEILSCDGLHGGVRARFNSVATIGGRKGGRGMEGARKREGG